MNLEMALCKYLYRKNRLYPKSATSSYKSFSSLIGESSTFKSKNSTFKSPTSRGKTNLHFRSSNGPEPTGDEEERIAKDWATVTHGQRLNRHAQRLQFSTKYQSP